VTHLVARRVSSITRLQKRGQLFHGKAEPDRVLDEPDPIDDVVGIKAIAGSRPLGPWQHAPTLVIANGVGAHSCTSRRFADGEGIRRHPDSIKVGVAPGSRLDLGAIRGRTL